MVPASLQVMLALTGRLNMRLALYASLDVMCTPDVPQESACKPCCDVHALV